MEITHRQREILRFLVKSTWEKGCAPSLREIAAQFRFNRRAAQDHIKALERKGYIRRHPRTARGIEVISRAQAIREIPIVGRVAAGTPIDALENLEGTINLPEEWATGEEVFILKVKGDSMASLLFDGDWAIVRKQPTAQNGDLVVARMGDEATIKRFQKRGAKIILKPENPDYEPILVKSDEVVIEGVVIGVYRKFR